MAALPLLSAALLPQTLLVAAGERNRDPRLLTLSLLNLTQISFYCITVHITAELEYRILQASPLPGSGFSDRVECVC